MPAFRDAFRRKAKLKKHQITRPRMHWRRKDNGYEVVSSVLCDRWDNAVHPENHDDFETKKIGGNSEDEGFTRYVPETASDWETFLTDETYMPRIFDRDAYLQFESAFRHDIDYLNADEVVEFLHGTFEAHYDFEDPRRDCSSCNGTGRIYDGESESLTYCYSNCGNGGKHEKLRVSDEACSCTSCNEPENMVECNECDGTGDIWRDGFTRTFPYNRDKFLSEKPSRREMQVLQFTLNKMAKIAEEKGTTVSFRKVIGLFHTVENSDTEALIDHAVSFIEPSLPTVKVPERDAEGQIVTDEHDNPEMEERPDPDAVKETKVKLAATLNDVSKQQAEAQYA